MDQHNTKAPKSDDDVLWGAEAIGSEIRRSARQTFHMLERGLLPAQKVGRLWCATRGDLRRRFRVKSANEAA